MVKENKINSELPKKSACLFLHPKILTNKTTSRTEKNREGYLAVVRKAIRNLANFLDDTNLADVTKLDGFVIRKNLGRCKKVYWTLDQKSYIDELEFPVDDYFFVTMSA